MPTQVDLISKSTGEKVNWSDIDDQMRTDFGVEQNEAEWFRNWYNRVGLPLACGRDWVWLKTIYSEDEEILPVLDWLEERFTVEAYKCAW